MAAFSREEYDRRIRAVQSQLAARGVDVLLCHNLSNICYLTGFQTIASYGYGHYAVIVPTSGTITLFTSDFESHNARLYGSVDDVHVYKVSEDIAGSSVAQLVDLLKRKGHARARIGYESGHFSMTADQFQQLHEQLPDAAWIAADEAMDTAKVIKSREEIAVMRRAAMLSSTGMNAAIRAARPGVTDNDIAAAAYQAIIQTGGDYFSLQPIVTTGPNSGIPHSTFLGRTIESNDLAFVEISASHHRYSAPAMRSIFVGPPTGEIRRAHRACVDSVRALTAGLKPGINARDVAGKVTRQMNIADLNLVWHGFFAYSVGLTFPPACTDCQSGFEITQESDLMLRPGMVFHCSTSLRKIGQYGVTAGETVLITDTGCEILTTAPHPHLE